MTPIIEVSNEVLKGLDKLSVPYNVREEKVEVSQDNSDFFYVPSIKLNVAEQITLSGKNWFEAHKELQSQGCRMPTLPEYVEILKYTRENLQEIYNDITEVRSPWRSEWIDADFKMKDGKLYVNSNHILDSNGDLVPEYSKPLSRTTLMKDSRISLDSWINNSTKQGFPSKKVKEGDLSYLNPRADDNSVARFYTGGVRALLGCGRSPSDSYSNLGVRAVKDE